MSSEDSVAVRMWSPREELANAASHGIGFLAALGCGTWLIQAALTHGDSFLVVGVIIFCLTAVALYFTSALHHALPVGPAKERAETLDHAAIFLLIAGTYTPVGLSLLRGPSGLTILVLIWAIALVGVTLRLLNRLKCPRISIALYVTMGWLMVAAKPFWTNFMQPGVLLLVSGGLVYTSGLIFYLARGIRYHHLIWHLFVMGGTTCHYAAVAWIITSRSAAG